jgi:hypothetical protein
VRDRDDAAGFAESELRHGIMLEQSLLVPVCEHHVIARRAKRRGQG